MERPELQDQIPLGKRWRKMREIGEEVIMVTNLKTVLFFLFRDLICQFSLSFLH